MTMNTSLSGIRSLAAALALPALGLAAFSAFAADEPRALSIAEGPFQGTYQSLSNYHYPDWFRNAKFGIWAHWGPQAVPMDGDWYARGMYEEGNKHYKYHRANYGHPSTNGYKDIIPLWKAEKWEPDRLMALYKKAGARYFVSMASHHDNFFLWNSKIHRWNSVNMGPKRDVVGDWQKAAAKQGLRFGVSEHLGASFTWFQSSHRSDKTGPMAGVPYDGADPQYQDLYHFAADPGDKGWYSTNPRWQQMWFDRIKELVDNYHPDLLYTDGAVPFGNEVGRSLIAHLYNSDIKRNGGKLEAVYNCKQNSHGMWAEDLERGVMPKINPYPWQTDTSIGDWYYNRDWKFRPVSWSIHMLVDIVSKNGNLLLNVVQRPDGSLDPQVESDLEALAQWIAIHGEAIYDTRPWFIYGEGAIKAKGGNFKEDFAYTSKDVRYTTKNGALYATALGWPEDGRVTLRSLASVQGGNTITDISILGSTAKPTWVQTTNGLVVTVPGGKVSPYTCALKITGTGLQAVAFPEIVEPVRADAKGVFTLAPDMAQLHGEQVKPEQHGRFSNLGFWDRGTDWVSWNLEVAKAGAFNVTAVCSAQQKGGDFVVEVAGQRLSSQSAVTGNWTNYSPVVVGRVDLPAGPAVLSFRPKDPATWKAINVRNVKLAPVK